MCPCGFHKCVADGPAQIAADPADLATAQLGSGAETEVYGTAEFATTKLKTYSTASSDNPTFGVAATADATDAAERNMATAQIATRSEYDSGGGLDDINMSVMSDELVTLATEV